jgi:hypothetical protein
MTRLLVLLIAAACAPAHAQNPNCAPYEMIVQGLSERYGERRVMSGLNPDGTLVQMFANPETGTWTALIVQPIGTACMVASGEQFDSTVAALPGNL